MTTFGSTQEETSVLTDEEMEVRKTAVKTATLAGISVELQIQKQRIAHLTKQLETLTGLYETVMGMYQQLNAARVRELNVRVNGGPTASD